MGWAGKRGERVLGRECTSKEQEVGFLFLSLSWELWNLECSTWKGQSNS